MSSSTYGVVPTAEDEEEPCSCVQRYLMGGSLTADQKAALASGQPEEPQEPLVLRLHSESIRQIAYGFFWSMCLLAIVLSKTMIPPQVIEESDLKNVFGYNNICVYWDYTPSRELTALYYPLFEYSFLLYVILDHIHFRLSFVDNHRHGIVLLAKITLPIKVLLIAWFRMIFVYQVNMQQPDYPEGYGPYIEGALGHTMGFFGLQLALILVALENVLYINMRGVEYPLLGKQGTRIASWLYFIVVTPLTLFKIYVAYTALIGHKINNFMVVGRIVDLIWMILIAFMPIVFAQIGRKTESHVKITFERDSLAWKDKGP